LFLFGLFSYLFGSKAVYNHKSKQIDKRIAEARKKGIGVMHTSHGDVPLG